MFIGHFALGFAAKRLVPRVSLAVLFAASQLADMLWPILVAVGAEEVRIEPGNTAFTPLNFVSYPWSHSLVLLALWGVLFGLACTRMKWVRAAMVIAALVVSHWVLDFVTHRPDMPFYPGGPKVGLGLWNAVPATLILESAMFGAGFTLYVRATNPKDRIGSWALWSLAAVLIGLYLANVSSPPPPSVGAIVAAGICGGVLLTAWAWWVDRHRR